MFPSSQQLTPTPPLAPPTGEGVNLEERLRGLIISNANNSSVNSNANTNPNAVPNERGPTPPAPQLPPQIIATGHPDQPKYSTQVNAQAEVAAENSPPAGLASPGRKRPNQAQRRQLNSQLSIPIDPRPNNGTQVRRGPVHRGSQNQTRPQQIFNGLPPMHHIQRFQQYSPRFQNSASPYSSRSFPSQPSPSSPMYPYQSGPPGPSPQFASRQGPAQFQNQNGNNYGRPPSQDRQLYHPGPQSSYNARQSMSCAPQEIALQSDYLQTLVQEHVPHVAIAPVEEAEKESFRALIEQLCRESIAEYEKQELGNEEFCPSTVELQCFGSMKSGFATKASDMDLALLSPQSHPAPYASESAIPRLLEKKLLSHGYGARLLTRTRVPIIKLCQKPTEKLLSDLLEARMKWENGFIGDADDEDDDLLEIEEPTESKEQSNQPKPSNLASPNIGSHSPKSKESLYEQKLSSLKQKEGQSLGDYYNSAKRLLRKLGGRDITASSPDLDVEEGRILNDVCKAFISGLASKALSASLRNYKSIMPLYDSSLPSQQRTLYGVWTQVDGERLALAWETRPLTENSEKLDYECLTVVQAWREIQSKTGLFVESILYNRALSQAVDRLKKINSLQLACLEQIQFEEPQFYYARTQKLQQDLLRSLDSQHIESAKAIIIAHYIAGVNNQQIREALQNFDRVGATLQQVALHHRALQLATDYEHALRVGTFDEADKADVEQYIKLLRRLQYDPNTDTEVALLAKIRTLPDPMVISLNKGRNRYSDHLEFPKTDIGIQCDINFSAHLGIHNTQLLRCYSQCDPRVKEMILFVKSWAKIRNINTPYRGTLSSYGYVLMVLHYLVNIVQPFVCPNLQIFNNAPPPNLPPAELQALTTCNGRNVKFWRNEVQIKNLADKMMLNHNHDSVGKLLRGFFEYYAQNQLMTTVASVSTRGFDYGVDVLSLRTAGGIRTKSEKGWTTAKTVIEVAKMAAPPTPSTPMPPTHPEVPSPGEAPPRTPNLPIKTVEEKKETRHRYLLAIEDPFELDHNVARTVTHDGICHIRDELRRAWRIIKSIGTDQVNKEGGLLDPLPSPSEGPNELLNLMDLLHGSAPKVKAEVDGEVTAGGAK